ncbi:Bacterio-opsin activator HTH domain-containing protein [Salinarchaeum sp. Harcht-Bsk1]|nr:Bacterio-opsin activator HTH domain-containing protein [Salinarchaeum sp. Harcht-Bsk1]
MGRQRTRRGRSLLDGGSSVDDAGSRTSEGVWDADAATASEATEPEETTPVSTEPETTAAVDLDKLTDRQREVLGTAYEMGYYQYPRGANASEVAEALDICPSTLAEHLAAAQTKVLDDLLADD